LQDAARARGIELSVSWVSKPEEIVPAIDKAQASGAQALNVLATPLFFGNQRLIIERTAALKLPAIYQWPEIAEAGGLAAYGPRITGIFRQRARQLAKILRGAKPADIPVEQPYKFELVINLKTAKALSLTVPPLLLAEADKVIELTELCNRLGSGVAGVPRATNGRLGWRPCETILWATSAQV
jgi:putative tryptophan/tyrosine transport system substrate-binding protein